MRVAPNHTPPSHRTGFMASALLLLLAACSSVRVQVREHEADLGRFETYAWQPGQSPDDAAVDAELASSFRERIEQHLAARGVREVPVSGADLLLSKEIQLVREVASIDAEYAVYYTAKKFEDAVLEVTLADSKSRNPVWSASARNRLRTAGLGHGLYSLDWVETGEEPRWDVSGMVDALFDRFPLAPLEEGAR